MPAPFENSNVAEFWIVTNSLGQEKPLKRCIANGQNYHCVHSFGMRAHKKKLMRAFFLRSETQVERKYAIKKIQCGKASLIYPVFLRR
jgi:hypothetical protein